MNGLVTPADLNLLSDITGVQVSADGALVAAVVSRPDIAANRYDRCIVAGPADGAAPLRRLTTADGTAETQPAWAPSGHDLATARQDESGWSIWVHNIGPGTAAPVLESWPDPIEEVAWSPAGDRLLFVVREPADREYWQTPEDRRPPLRLTTLRYREDGTGWTAGRPRQGYVVATAPARSRARSAPAVTTTPGSAGTPTRAGSYSCRSVSPAWTAPWSTMSTSRTPTARARPSG